jgi:hypothetical protein
MYGTYWYTSQNLRPPNLNRHLAFTNPYATITSTTFSTQQHHLSLIFFSLIRDTPRNYTPYSHISANRSRYSYLTSSTTDGTTVASPHSTPTYFTQRQTLTHASLSQGDRPAGQGAAQTSIFWGRGLRTKIHTAAGLSNPHPRPKIHTAGAHPSLSQPMGSCRSPTLGKQWSHRPSPSLGNLWGHCPSPTLGKQWSHSRSPT